MLEEPLPVNEESAPQEEIQVQQAPPQEDPQEKNWKEVRAQMKELKREKEALQAQIEKLANQKSMSEPDDDMGMRDDDLVDAKTAKRMAEKILEKKLQHLQSQQASELAELRLKAKFPDIENVVTPQAIEELRENEPELYATVMAQQDIYAKGAAAYKLIKNMKKSNHDPYAKERAKAEVNMKKPVSSTSVKGGTGSEADSAFVNGLTPDLKKKLYQEMQEARRNINNNR